MYGQHIQFQSHNSSGGNLMIENVENILMVLSKQQQNKLKDFLLSEIDDDVLEETIKFVLSDDNEKKEKFQNLLYDGEKYDGVFLEGNQYLIASTDKSVVLIDALSEEKGVNELDTRIKVDINHFISLISNKMKVLNLLDAR